MIFAAVVPLIEMAQYRAPVGALYIYILLLDVPSSSIAKTWLAPEGGNPGAVSPAMKSVPASDLNQDDATVCVQTSDARATADEVVKMNDV